MSKFIELFGKTKGVASQAAYTMKIVWGVIATFALIILYNPSGWSYFHFMQKHDWSSFGNTEVGILAGMVFLASPVVLDMPSAWSAAGKKGKFLFFIYLLLVGALMYTSGWYKNYENVVWVLEIAAIAFMAWGAFVNLRDKRKYAKISTVEDGPLEIDENSDMDDD